MSTESFKELPWLSDKVTRDLVVLKLRGLSFKKTKGGKYIYKKKKPYFEMIEKKNLSDCL